MRKLLIAIFTALGISTGAKAQINRLDEGLKETLASTSKRFEKRNHPFLINVVKDKSVVIQIVHGALVKQTRTFTNYFNYSIHIPFYEQDENLSKFKNLDISKEFIFYEWDGIPFYAYNFGNDQNKTYQWVMSILLKVFGFNKEDIFEFEIFDQG